MVEIKLDQSLCGENEKKAYGLLRTTIANTEEAKVLANKSDLPDHTLGIKFSPALRGFSEGEYFLIMRTFKDMSPEVRPNRVFTHMLTASAKDICNFPDLWSICDLLQVEPSKTERISPVTAKTIPVNSHIDEASKGRFHKLINGFINRGDFLNTIVWVGQDGFVEAICELWARLSTSERAELNFGIYFGTENISDNKTNIICVPESLQSKFIKKGYYIVGINDQHQPVELSELILAGDPAAIQRIKSFSNALGISHFKRNQVDAIVTGIKTFETIDEVNDLKKINTLSHIVATYAPDPKAGAKLKEKIIEKLTELIDQNTSTDFIVLKHFKVESFSQSKQKLSGAIIRWLGNVFFKPITRKATNLTPIFDLLSDSSNWLSDILRKELKSYLSHLTRDKVKILYQWLASFPGTLESCKNYIDKGEDSEDLFIQLLPKGMGAGLLKVMKQFAANTGWFRLHAHLFIVSGISLEKALQAHLLIDRNFNDDRAVEILARKFSQQAIIDFTITNPDVRLISFCGKICAAKPLLFTKIDVTEYTWQLVWLAAIASGKALKDSSKSLQAVVFRVFDLLIEKKKVVPELIDKIAESPFADVREYTNINKLWPVLTPGNREKMLNATSSKLLGELAKNPTTNVPNDLTLSDFIFKDGISDFLYYNRDNIGSTLPIFSKYPHLKEEVLCHYLDNYAGDISQKDATALGKMILQRRFLNASSIVFKKTRKHNNWRFALAECHSQLGIMAKAVIYIGGLIKKVKIPSDEWWDAVNDVVINLYPNPTSMTTIWKKSGGKEYDLKSNGSTRDIWLDALHRLRHRAIKHITMNDLLKEIKKDYNHHDDFRTLYEIRDQFIKVK
jgi:hypothetical protein